MVVKKLKMIRNITLGLLICFALFLMCVGILQFLDGNYYSDNMGVTVFYWYDRFLIELGFYLYMFGIPVIIDGIICVYSIIKIKKISKDC